MSEYTTEKEAAEALYAAVLEEGGARSDHQALDTRVNEIKAGQNQPDDAAEGSTGTTEKSDSFIDFDPNELPPELQERYKQMNTAWTQKTQALAEERKQYEALTEFGGAEAAIEAVKFAQALATDPNYALQVHEQLTQALTEAGLTPSQASKEAARQIDEAATTTETDFEDFEDGGATAKELVALKGQLEELNKWKKGQEDSQFEIRLANEMAQQENTILQQHPEYTDTDIEDIYALSYSVGGNLLQAAEVFTTLKQRVLDDYLSKKSSVSAGASGITSTVTSADVPTKFANLYDPDLEKLVNERLAQEIAAGNI